MSVLNKTLLIPASFFCLLLFSCKPSYLSFVPHYKKVFSEETTQAPDYSSINYWAAHPWKKDPSDSMPKLLQSELKDTSVDVFFLHPTTLTDKNLSGIVWNADINDPVINSKTDYSSILYQASVFNESCRVFAPRYRQAHLSAFFSKDSVVTKKAFDLAYEDVRTAFVYYLQYHNNGRPVIIASHSQGTVHAFKLLKEFFENKPLQNNLVCAYLVGMVIPRQLFNSITPCSDSSSTGCFVGWRTYKRNYLPEFVKLENNNSWVTNPLSWNMTEASVSRQANKGAVLFNFEKILPHTNGATIHEGVVWIERPKFPFGFLSSRKNYHPGDINLFYMNIRSNIQTRIKAYFKQKKK